MKIKKIITIAAINLLIIGIALPALSGSSKRRGKTYRSNTVEISNIESKRLEKDKSGLIWYSIKANVRNRAKRDITVTVCFQAVDRSGYELKDVCFYDKAIRKNDTRILSERTVIDAEDYKNTWEWKIEELRVE